MNPWLLLGAVLGYGVLMGTNPIRASLVDGLRALRRYPALWLVLGFCGCGYALFYAGADLYVAWRLAAGGGWVPRLARSPFQWEAGWFFGREDSLWHLLPSEVRAAGREAFLPALDSTAGLFHNLVSTFPLAALAALLLWLNWAGFQGVLWRALHKRFPWTGWLLHLATLLCATAALVKPVLIFYRPPLDPLLLQQWLPVIAWLAVLFEYACGVGIQIYLVLLAYCWVRGLNFTHGQLVAVAIRRLSIVLRWAAILMLLSSMFIDLPLILRHFPRFADVMPTPAEFESRFVAARIFLDAFILFFATVQIALTFHSETLGRGLTDHGLFVMRHWWPLGWLLVIAGLHFYGAHWLNLFALRALEEGTLAALGWKILFPWLTAVLGAWFLASWVGIYRRASGHRGQDAALSRF